MESENPEGHSSKQKSPSPSNHSQAEWKINGDMISSCVLRIRKSTRDYGRTYIKYKKYNLHHSIFDCTCVDRRISFSDISFRTKIGRSLKHKNGITAPKCCSMIATHMSYINTGKHSQKENAISFNWKCL